MGFLVRVVGSVIQSKYYLLEMPKLIKNKIPRFTDKNFTFFLQNPWYAYYECYPIAKKSPPGSGGEQTLKG
jgi:hypothetical protein